MYLCNHKREIERDGAAAAAVLPHFSLMAEGQDSFRGDIQTHENVSHCWPEVGCPCAQSLCLPGLICSAHFNKQQNATTVKLS